MQDIAPGSDVKVTITNRVTNEAARKTLQRVLAKSDDAKAEKKRQQKVRERHNRPYIRSGRVWVDRVPKFPVVSLEPGSSETIKATVDVLNDLKSVQRFVEVQPA